jgi:cytochrome P450
MNRATKADWLRLAYGVRTPTIESPHLKRVVDALDLWLSIMEQGAHPPIDLLPVLKWIPERFWRNWKSRAAECSKELNSLYSGFLEMVVQRRKTEGKRNSVADAILDQQDKLGLTWTQQCWVLASLVEAGSETTATVITVFLQAMLKYPEVKKKAQKCIDDNIDGNRSPQWSDYAELPYITQVIKEVFRWRPIAPLGFPHYLTEGKPNVAT